MKKLFFLSLITLINYQLFSQSDTRDYIYLAERLFDKKLTVEDFSNEVLFFTIDTIDATDIYASSVYKEYSDKNQLLSEFYHLFNSLKTEGGFYNYYELIDCSFYPSPLHQSFLVNTASTKFKIDIWNNKDDITKIDGLTVQDLKRKEKRTPY